MFDQKENNKRIRKKKKIPFSNPFHQCLIIFNNEQWQQAQFL